LESLGEPRLTARYAVNAADKPALWQHSNVVSRQLALNSQTLQRKTLLTQLSQAGRTRKRQCHDLVRPTGYRVLRAVLISQMTQLLRNLEWQGLQSNGITTDLQRREVEPTCSY
jgi:hypothetical protein